MSSFKILKNLKSNLKGKKILFFVAPLSHCCKLKIEQCVSKSIISFTTVFPLRYTARCVLSCLNILIQFHITLKEFPYIFSLKVSLKKNQALKLLLVTPVVDGVLYLDLWTRKRSNFIFIVISDTISVAERRI